MMWNASDRQRRNVVGCFLSHLRVLKMIVKKRLNKVIVMEDDAVMDFKALNKVNLNKWYQDKMIYVGGILKPLTLKDKKWSYEETKKLLKKGLNKIDPKKYKVGGAHAYYFPTWKSSKKIVDYIESKDKVRAIDTEFIIMQKTRPDLIEQLYFPALAYLNVGEALEGFTGKAYGIPRDMKQYGGGFISGKVKAPKKMATAAEGKAPAPASASAAAPALAPASAPAQAPRPDSGSISGTGTSTSTSTGSGTGTGTGTSIGTSIGTRSSSRETVTCSCRSKKTI